MVKRNIIVVGYTYANDAAWEAVFAHAASIYAVILNCNSGPGDARDNAYVALAARLKAAGIKVLGYVYTATDGIDPATNEQIRVYCTRSQDEIRAAVIAWNTWYAVDGIFFDEVASDVSKLDYCRRIAAIGRSGTNDIIVFNHGVVPDPQYAAIANILCVAETDQRNYFSKVFPTWFVSFQPEHFYHIVYGVTDANAVLAKMRQNDAGYIYLSRAQGPEPQFGVETTVWPLPEVVQPTPPTAPTPPTPQTEPMSVLIKRATPEELAAEFLRRMHSV